MTGSTFTDRRTVLRTIGAGVCGGLAATLPATAHEPESNGQIPVFLTWGDGEIYEMVDAEPPSRDRMQDAEGNDNAHAPLYLIETLEDTGVDGSGHSPHFGSFDQVVSVPGGPSSDEFSAQWHPKLVLDGGEVTNTDQDGNYLTSASAVQNAENVTIAALPETEVFTCPVRPHRSRGHEH